MDRLGRNVKDLVTLVGKLEQQGIHFNDQIATGTFGGVSHKTPYADQAHMTREIRKWLGVSPKQAQTDSALLALLHETGYH